MNQDEKNKRILQVLRRPASFYKHLREIEAIANSPLYLPENGSSQHQE